MLADVPALVTDSGVRPIFLATVEVVEKAVNNAVPRATAVTGRDGRTLESTPIDARVP
jgi:L-aminopeptidase/D-esterase-like protein